MTTLAEADAPIQLAHAHRVRIESAGPRVRVWFDDDRAPRIDVSDPAPLRERGQAGVTSWGAPLNVDAFSVQIGSRILDATTQEKSPGVIRDQALAAFCLLMLNLNELVYVD